MLNENPSICQFAIRTILRAASLRRFKERILAHPYHLPILSYSSHLIFMFTCPAFCSPAPNQMCRWGVVARPGTRRIGSVSQSLLQSSGYYCIHTYVHPVIGNKIMSTYVPSMTCLSRLLTWYYIGYVLGGCIQELKETWRSCRYTCNRIESLITFSVERWMVLHHDHPHTLFSRHAGIELHSDYEPGTSSSSSSSSTPHIVKVIDSPWSALVPPIYLSVQLMMSVILGRVFDGNR